MRHEPLLYRDRARQLREEQTAAEAMMWNIVRGRHFLGLKFHRQFEVGHYILDFFCEELLLAIELDGEGHFVPGAFEADAVRTRYLQSLGITLTRVENIELLENPEVVMARIARMIPELERLRFGRSREMRAGI